MSEETRTREAIVLMVKKLDFGLAHAVFGVVVEFSMAAFAIVIKIDNKKKEAMLPHR